MTNPIIVAAIQFTPVQKDVTKNLASVLQLSFEAAQSGAKLIVLPELSLCGDIIDNTCATECAQDKRGYQTEAFIAVTKQFNCHIVFGYVELCDGNLYNSAAVVGPNGLDGNFQKHNLCGSDNLWAEASVQFVPHVITQVGRVGILLCRDVINNYRESYSFFNPKHKFYKKGDIDTVCLLTKSSLASDYPDSSWIDLSESTNANIIVSTRINEEKPRCGSAVINHNRIWTNKGDLTKSAIVGGLVTL